MGEHWIPMQGNADADWIITRLGIQELVYSCLEGFRRIWDRFGPFEYDYIAISPPIQRVPAGWPKAVQPLLFFAQFPCTGA